MATSSRRESPPRRGFRNFLTGDATLGGRIGGNPRGLPVAGLHRSAAILLYFPRGPEMSRPPTPLGTIRPLPDA